MTFSKPLPLGDFFQISISSQFSLRQVRWQLFNGWPVHLITFPLIFSPIFLVYFRRNFPMRFPHPNKNSHTCRSGWQDIAFTQPPKIFAHFRDISFISLQHFEVLLNKQLVFSRIVGTILFWEILISAQVREGLLCWVGLDEEGHSKCQHKQCSFSYKICSQWPVTQP